MPREKVENVRDALIVGRDDEGARYLAQALGEAEVHCAYVDADEAVHRLGILQPELVILDLPLLDDASIFLCSRVREIFDGPIVIYSMSNHESDVVKAFHAGVDDYLAIPMRPAELTARVMAVMRRAPGVERSGEKQDVIRAGDVEVHITAHRVYRDDEKVSLSPIEFRLLVALMRQQGRPVSHTRLLLSVWGPEYVDCRHYLRLYVKYLRSKIERDPSEPKVILNEWGVGYRFEPCR